MEKRLGASCLAARNPHEVRDDYCYLFRQEGGDGIADLRVLLCPVPLEEVVVWEGLQTGNLSHGKAPALGWVGVNEIMSVLGDVGDHGGRWMTSQLDAEAVGERRVVVRRILMVRK